MEYSLLGPTGVKVSKICLGTATFGVAPDAQEAERVVHLALDGPPRALRLLRADKRLELNARIRLKSGPAYESFNVVGEIRGSEKPEEIMLVGGQYISRSISTNPASSSHLR